MRGPSGGAGRSRTEDDQFRGLPAEPYREQVVEVALAAQDGDFGDRVCRRAAMVSPLYVSSSAFGAGT
jgi:hypothetical protein